jgi:threonine dehydratase
MATPIVQIDNIYFKREDTNLTGSIKDRSVPIQLKNISSQGIYKAVISSTGNAAISASFFAHKYNIDLTIFVSPKVNQNKLKLLDYSAVIKSHTPVSDAFKYAKDTNSFYLRQSTDPIAQKPTPALVKNKHSASLLLPAIFTRK